MREMSFLLAAGLLVMCHRGGDTIPPASKVETVANAEDVVEVVKRTDVSTLDAALASQPLEAWLSSAELRLEQIRWSKSDCEVKPDSATTDYPLCVRVDFRRGDGWGWLSLRVGSTNGGVAERPQFGAATATTAELAKRGEFHEAAKLSDLPHVLDDVDRAHANRRPASPGR